VEDADVTQALFQFYTSKICHTGVDRGSASMSFLQDWRGIDFWGNLLQESKSLPYTFCPTVFIHCHLPTAHGSVVSKTRVVARCTFLPLICLFKPMQSFSTCSLLCQFWNTQSSGGSRKAGPPENPSQLSTKHLIQILVGSAKKHSDLCRIPLVFFLL